MIWKSYVFPELTFYIEKGNKDLEKITESAFSEWENNLNKIYFKNVKDNNVADIQIKFKKNSNYLILLMHVFITVLKWTINIHYNQSSIDNTHI